MTALIARYRMWAAIVVLVCLGKLEASAQLAIEIYDGPRPAVATPTLQRLQPIFARHGISAGPQQVRAMLRDVARPGVSDPRLTYSRIVERIELAANLFLQSGPEKLAAVRVQFESVIADARANPAIVALAEGSPQVMTRAYALLALCRFKQGDKKAAAAVLAEQARSYPELPVEKFGPEMAALSREVRAADARVQPGELTIEASSRDAQIYINEFSRGQSGRFSGKLVPGAYRVLVRVGDKSLAYDVDVVAGKTTRLELDWSLELALNVSDEWVGVTLAKGSQKDGELASAIAMSRKTGMPSIVVIHVAEVQNRPQMTLALYEQLAPDRSSASVRLSRRGRVSLTGDQRDDQRLDALAMFVSKGIPSQEVEDLTATSRDSESSTTPVAAHAPPSDSRRSTGSARWKRALPYLFVIGGGVAVLTGGVVYALDEDRTQGGTMDPSYTDTAPYGIAIGAAGAVSIGVGTWLWLRRHRSAPTIAVGRSSAMFGWAGTF